MARNKVKSKGKKKPAAKPAKTKKTAVKGKKPALKAKVAKPAPKAAKAKKAAVRVKKAAMPAKKTGSINWSEIFTPLDDRVLIEVEQETRTVGGLFIPSSASEKPQRGTVRAVGRGRCDKKGRVRPMDVTVGDEVLFAAFAGTSVNLGARDIIILRETDLLGIVE